MCSYIYSFQHCHTDTPLTTRDLKYIQEALYDAHTHWYDIGLELDVDPETLKTISTEHSSPGERLREMILLRLKSSTLTWRLIIESLRSKIVARNDVANNIEQELIQKEDKISPVRSQEPPTLGASKDCETNQVEQGKSN